MLLRRVKCFYAGVRWALVLPTEAVLTRQALAAALTAALGQVGALSSMQTCDDCIPVTGLLILMHRADSQNWQPQSSLTKKP